MTPKTPQLTEGKADNLEIGKIEESLKQVSSQKRVLESEIRTGAPSGSNTTTDITSTKGKKGAKAVSKFQQPKSADSLGVSLLVDQVMDLLQDFRQPKPDMLGNKKKNDRGKNENGLRTSTALSNHSKFASTARAKYNILLEAEELLKKAVQNKYIFSPEQLFRLEQGISTLPADLQREHGAGLNRLEQALDGIKINNGLPMGTRNLGINNRHENKRKNTRALA